ncbi:MAG: alpha/beta hydrolase-fold protein [Eubacteriales bacterium]|nr:alpha/beta hydrolase-fold protein [Eubacteriales bacterium]MDD3880740.1 alpha/beta hydrolase-fold protein [Eubacteriales bacterium]MDD3882913.1 alpha/beta hydrolase-fold protein [Eubacteriales bacterium]MDD4511627.1 alpha/beta hydrolase-fold protein [Eubacteriales bacterium]
MAVLSGVYHSCARPGAQKFTAIIPVEARDGYKSGPFKTIYLLHGYTGSEMDWLRHSLIEDWSAHYGIAVIMPDGSNRFYIDNEESGENFGILTGDELLRVTRNMFPLSDKREDTAIGGFSMGGFGAIRNGLCYNSSFGAVIGLSSALITDKVAEMKKGDTRGEVVAPYGYYRQTFGEMKNVKGGVNDPKALAAKALKSGTFPRLFLACGTEDFLYQPNLDFHTELGKIGYEHEWRAAEGVHDFRFWNRMIQEGLKWWLEAK